MLPCCRRQGMQPQTSLACCRANLFVQAGANASFVEGPRNVDELREIGRQTKVGVRASGSQGLSPDG